MRRRTTRATRTDTLLPYTTLFRSPQTSGYPFHLLDVELAQQNTGAGTTFLRWRTHDRSVMGVALWQGLMVSAAMPVTLLDDVHPFERQRIVINMRNSLLHQHGRQDRDGENGRA